MIGEMLANRYQILARVGEGGMAVVYSARDRLLGRLVAVKVLRPQFAADEEFVERFRREAQAAAILSHPNVVNIYDVGQQADVHYIVMEYVNGPNLKEVLRRRGALSPEEAVFVAREVARALHAAHRHALVHRDVKPHNILLTADGQVKVTDFGIARAASTATLTHTGTVMGSVHYFSPEQARGTQVGVQSDLYALGVVLYEMLTGTVPFTGESPVTVAIKHLQEEPEPPSHRRPGLPPELERITLKLMAKDLAARYGSAAELLADLQALPARPPLVEAAPPAVGEETVVLPALEEPTVLLNPTRGEAGPPTSPTAPPRRRWRQLSLLVIALAFFAGLAWAGQNVPPGLWRPAVRVPDVRGEPLEQARQALRAQGLRLVVDREVFNTEVPPGHVIAQEPGANARVPAGRAVYVRVSRGPEFVLVPDVIGLAVRDGRSRLTQAGLTVGRVRTEARPGAQPDQIVGQDPPAGSRLQRGLAVDLVVTPAVVTVPDLRGLSTDQASARLRNLGLRVGRVDRQPSPEPVGQVLGQRPEAGASVSVGSAVDLVTSAGMAEVGPPEGAEGPGAGPVGGGPPSGRSLGRGTTLEAGAGPL